MDPNGARIAMQQVIAGLLDTQVGDRLFRAELRRLLSAEGFILSDQPQSRLAVGIVLCYEAVSSRPGDEVAPAAAALDLAFSAIELVDKAIDQEQPDMESWEPSRAVNAALCLQALSSQAIQLLHARGFSDPQVRRVQQELVAIVAETSAAQHLDLVYERDAFPSFEQSLEMTILKGGALTSSIGRLGAFLASPDPEVVGAFTTFGWHTGTYAQLVNDLNDALPGHEHKADIRQRKKTLPIVYLLQSADPSFAQEREWLLNSDPLSPAQEGRIRQAIVSSGARDFTAVMAEAYQARARDSIRQLGSGVKTEQLIEVLFGPTDAGLI